MQAQLLDILEDNYGVSRKVLDEVLRITQEKGSSLGETLISKSVLSEAEYLQALGSLYDVPFWPELPLDNIDFEFTHHVPIQFLKKYSMVPLVIKVQQREAEKNDLDE